MWPMANQSVRVVHHGNTPAAWTAVVIITLGFILGVLGLILSSPAVLWTGVALVPIGAIVGKVMQLMGLGAVPKR